MQRMFGISKEVMVDYMFLPEYKKCLYSMYKENTKQISKLVDLVEIFSEVNRLMVLKDDARIALRKKSRVSSLFRKSAKSFNRIEELLKEIRVKPVMGPEHTIWNYYNDTGDFERITFDT
jgi:hypothetical protein